MEQKIKVAHVIRVFSYGGAEILLREFFTNPIFKQAVSSHLYILDHKKLGLVPEVAASCAESTPLQNQFPPISV
jgi:hypothetical protein